MSSSNARLAEQDRLERVGRLVDRILELEAAGDSRGVSELLDANRDVADDVRGQIDFLRQLDGLYDEDSARPPKTIGDFRIVREIGRGGMGLVYEAEQISLGRRVALKVLPFTGLLDSRQLKRFKNEARAAAQLEHRNIVPVHAVGSDHGVHYYAMQLIEGRSLDKVLAELRAHRSEHPGSSATRLLSLDGNGSSRSSAAATSPSEDARGHEGVIPGHYNVNAGNKAIAAGECGIGGIGYVDYHEAAVTVGPRLDSVTPTAQRLAERVPHQLVVVDDEHTGTVSARCIPGLAGGAHVTFASCS